MAFDNLLVGIEDAHEPVLHIFACGAARAHDFRAGELGSFSEAGSGAERVEFVDQITDRGAGGQSRSRITFAALSGNE